jgi:hypothetical protein
MKRVCPDAAFNDVIRGLDAGDDPRLAIARLNAKIIDFQRAGQEVPPRLLRLSKQLATECAVQSQGR